MGKETRIRMIMKEEKGDTPFHRLTNGIRSGGCSPPPGVQLARSLRSPASFPPHFFSC